MAANTDITGFFKGEVVDINFLAKNRDGSVISSPATATVSMTIGNNPVDEPSLTFSTATGEITLVSAPTGSFRIFLEPTDLVSLAEGKVYYYNIWTWQTSTEKTLQAYGRFVLQNSISPP
jgi:hypothetical protein